MRKSTLIHGFKNSQKIRVMIDGIGFYTTVIGTSDICTRKHRMAVQTALMNLAYDRAMALVRHTPEPVGFGLNYNYFEEYRPSGQPDAVISVQVDLCE
jgi:hypothetical protein